jgi:hypothetical protein
MKTEADVAAHLGVRACIIYAQAFSTSSSVIPSFLKRGDIIVADKTVNYSIRKGIQISRSTVRWYEHNDMEDLERVLQKITKEQARKPLTRRFIITEGLFENVGDCVDLPKVVGAYLSSIPIAEANSPRSNSSSSTSSDCSSTKPGPTEFLEGLAAVLLKHKMWTRTKLICSSVPSPALSALLAAFVRVPKKLWSISVFRQLHIPTQLLSLRCCLPQLARRSRCCRNSLRF